VKACEYPESPASVPGVDDMQETIEELMLDEDWLVERAKKRVVA